MGLEPGRACRLGLGRGGEGAESHCEIQNTPLRAGSHSPRSSKTLACALNEHAIVHWVHLA